MSTTYIVTTSTGLTFTYAESWQAEGKQKELFDSAAALNVAPFSVTRTQVTEDGNSTKRDIKATWER